MRTWVRTRAGKTQRCVQVDSGVTVKTCTWLGVEGKLFQEERES